MNPLELVKAARKAHGESTEVGTEEDLWGPQDNQTTHPQKDSSGAVPRVNMSMPTHLEIGLLPQTTMPPDAGVYDYYVSSLVTTITAFWLVAYHEILLSPILILVV